MTCTGLHCASLVDGAGEQFTISGCLLSFLIIGLAQSFGELFGGNMKYIVLCNFFLVPIYIEVVHDAYAMPKLVEIYFFLNGSMFFLAVACLCVQYHDNAAIKLNHVQNLVLAKGILAAFNSTLYMISVYLSIRA